ncbi:MAG: 4-hydroxy-3-methylbut-2-enyl diphosphate reductase [Tagaea sp.]
MRVLLAQPRGFCAGVERAIEIVERALAKHGAPVYVRHEIVHNRHVVEDLRAKGAVFVDELDQVPDGAIAIFSAHGVARSVETEAERRGLAAIDATCPLVKKVHFEGQRYAAQGREVVLIGHPGHPEVVGTLGQIPGTVHLVRNPADVAALRVAESARLAYVSQTTLSVDETRETAQALQARFPSIVGPDTKDICYATQNRQTAVRALARAADAVIVVGAANSSNSTRLRELAAEYVPAYLLEDPRDLDWAWLDGVATLGVTAGASAPERLVDDLLAALAARGPVELVSLPGVEEAVRFRLPAEVA